jgi:Rrf2 family protein
MAVHVLAVLAYKGGERVTSQLLAGSINTNPVIVRRLLLALQKAGLVETRKGAGFGSRLVSSPAEINLARVYRAVEEDEPFNLPARKPNPSCPVGKNIQAALETIFCAAQQALEQELARTSLADVLDRVNTLRLPEGSKA